MKNHSKRRSERIRLQNSPYPTEKRNQFELSSSLSPRKDENDPAIKDSASPSDVVVSDSLISYVRGQLDLEISSLFATFHPSATKEEVYQFEDYVFRQLLQMTMGETGDLTNMKSNNETFSRHSRALVKAIHLFNDARFESFFKKELAVQQILEDYDEYIHRNQIIFQNITSHHDNVANVEWEKVVENTDSLQDYAVAANEMGNKIWVYESNRYACNYCVRFFVGNVPTDPTSRNRSLSTTSTEGSSGRQSNLAIKFYMKELAQQKKLQQLEESNASSIENEKPYWDSLYASLSAVPLVDYFQDPDQNKIKLLDVGSCYNPLLKYEDLLPYFDITAIDLCPVDPSVYKCDFLTVDITDSVESYQSHKISCAAKPSQSAPHPSSSTSTDSPAESQYHELKMLPSNHFDVIIMSLVLSYLPTPETREIMIDKARKLLVSPGHNGKPHYGGLLIIIEKQSIFSPAHTQTKITTRSTNRDSSDSSSSDTECVISPDDWKISIANKGFYLLSHQLYVSTDKRKSHIFIFKTSNSSPIVSNSSTDSGDGKPITVKPLWIKHDFYRQKESKS
jgi:hypothetical protein